MEIFFQAVRPLTTATVLAMVPFVAIAQTEQTGTVNTDNPIVAETKTSEETDAELSFGSNFRDMQSDIFFEFSALSDYVSRGISYTDRNPGWSAYFEGSYGPFYSGVFIYKIDTPTGDETDVFVGFRPEVGKFSFDVSYWYYFTGDREADYDEWFASAYYNLQDNATIGTTVTYADDYSGSGLDSTGYEVNGSYTFSPKWSAAAAFGRLTFDDNEFGLNDRTYWQAGITYAATDAISLTANYHDTNLSQDECFGTDLCESGIAFSISYSGSVRDLLTSK